jgi:GNAT superfamily N-acetyltransferase
LALPATAIEISIPRPADGERLLELARGIKLFTPEDIDTVHELWTEFITKGDDSWYHFVVARRGKELLGFSCFGRRALTDGTWDLYWIGVSQSAQGQGIGKLLLQDAESRVKALGGRLLIIETAGKTEFESTRQFYLHAGCNLEARIRDFYAIGDDLFIYTVKL